MGVRMKGVWREVWEICGRCGFPYPLSMLTKQKGLLVCSGCFDNTLVERRSQMIDQVLADGQEGDNPKAEKQASDDTFEIMF